MNNRSGEYARIWKYGGMCFVKSMTGYGVAAQTTAAGRSRSRSGLSTTGIWIGSVKLPRVFGFAEDAVKGRVKEEISRGKVDVFISVNVTADAEMKISLNRPVLEGYLAALNTISKDYGRAKRRHRDVAGADARCVRRGKAGRGREADHGGHFVRGE